MPYRSSAAKLLLLLFFIVALFLYFKWKEDTGVIGSVKPLPSSSAGQIVFVRQTGGQTDLYVVDADGKNLRRLTNSKANKRAPSWSPDGKQLCYAAEPDNPAEDGRAFQLYILGADGSKQLSQGSIGKDSPHWRADGKQIGFLSGGAIKVIAPNGSGLEQIFPVRQKVDPNGSGNDEDSDKAPPIQWFHWAPIGTALAGVQQLEGENAITLGRQQWWDKNAGAAQPDQDAPAVSEPEQLVLMTDPDAKPIMPQLAAGEKMSLAWFPDGVRVVAVISTRGQAHAMAIYRLDAPSAEPTPIFVSVGKTVVPESPAVSPDGTQVAFELWRTTGGETRELLGIAVVSTGSDPLMVRSAADIAKVPVTIKGDTRSPQWSPDGSRLLFWRSGKNGRDLWTAHADGSAAVNLTNGAGDDFDAMWSPAKR